MCLTNTARELEIDAIPKAKDHPEIGRETLTTQDREMMGVKSHPFV